MTRSPILISFLLHVVVLGALWHCACARRVAAIPQPPLYVELASFPAPLSVPPALAWAAPARAAKEEVAREILPDPEGEAEPAPSAERPAGSRSVAAPPATSASPAAAAIASASQIPSQAAAPVAPELSRAFSDASRQQFMMIRTRRFLEVAGMAAKKIVEGKLPPTSRQELEGETAEVVLCYGVGEGRPLVSSDNPRLRGLLEGAAWSHIPQPGDFSLQYKQVAFLVSLEKGGIRVGLSPR